MDDPSVGNIGFGGKLPPLLELKLGEPAPTSAARSVEEGPGAGLIMLLEAPRIERQTEHDERRLNFSLRIFEFDDGSKFFIPLGVSLSHLEQGKVQIRRMVYYI